jgi:hypothetical protein
MLLYIDEKGNLKAKKKEKRKKYVNKYIYSHIFVEFNWKKKKNMKYNYVIPKKEIFLLTFLFKFNLPISISFDSISLLVLQRHDELNGKRSTAATAAAAAPKDKQTEIKEKI